MHGERRTKSDPLLLCTGCLASRVDSRSGLYGLGLIMAEAGLVFVGPWLLGGLDLGQTEFRLGQSLGLRSDTKLKKMTK